MTITAKSFRWFIKAIGDMIHTPGVGGWLVLNQTKINYENLVFPEKNSIVVACVRWLQRTFSEAPLMLQLWLDDRQEWEPHHRDEILTLLERPNPFYNGTTLFKAMVADLIFNGSAYWYKVRDGQGKVVQLWWLPSAIIEPKGDLRDPTVFISYYEYTPDGFPVTLRIEDVIQFRDGIDPSNPRKGLSPTKALLREIFTDDQAANMTASLIRNMGVPGVVISPKQSRIGPEAAMRIKEQYIAKFTGDKMGEPLVLEGDVTVTQFGFSPQQMELRMLRGIPEERITAVLGVNAAVVSLGAGLATTKVGATLREYREEAIESTIMPMYREIAAELTHQLLPEFKNTRDWRLVFDVSQIRVLGADERLRAERIGRLVTDGIIRISEGRRALGLPVLPEHEIYLRPNTHHQIPAGPLRVQTNPQPAPQLPEDVEASVNGYRNGVLVQ